jgi:mannose/cellobiose epimerase-like protein (N-acyl-D-glucosamine 2-epimerase family)
VKSLSAPVAEIREWLVQAAYPLWATRGIDHRSGGFVEALDQEAIALDIPRRARVQPRQIYAFAHAAQFGWLGPTQDIVLRGTKYFESHYRRADGLFRSLVSHAGAVLDERALLYDQAFALLGYASAARAIPLSRRAFEARAIELRATIQRHFAAPDGAYFSDEELGPQRESNPHMHLLEACLAWAEIGEDPDWTAGVTRLVELALSRFTHKCSGAIGELYDDQGMPSLRDGGRVEPGHQFEWAWLLLRSIPYHVFPARAAALRLIAIGEEYGVHDGVAVNALRDDLSVEDPRARLWPQTERLKAALRAASVTHDPTYQSIANSAAASMLSYLRSRGLWFDQRLPTGDFVHSPAPASTFYHVVAAAAELEPALLEGDT